MARKKFKKRDPVSASIAAHERMARKHYKAYDADHRKTRDLDMYAYHTSVADMQKREKRVVGSEKRTLFDSIINKNRFA